MQLSISCRIAEGFLSKEEASLSLSELAGLAKSAGYQAICMRASQTGVQSTRAEWQTARKILEDRGLVVSMVTGDFDIVYNNDRGPDCLRRIEPYLDLAETLGAPMIRVCLKSREDFEAARDAADRAGDRGLTLVHQCHTLSLFETIDGTIETLNAIDRPNFGLIYEAANLEGCRQDYGPATIRQLAPWIRNVYLQNQIVRPSGAVTLDTWCHGPVTFDVTQIHEPDGIDFDSVVTGLKSVGYDGTITVHQSGPEDGTTSATDAATQTAMYLRQLWNA